MYLRCKHYRLLSTGTQFVFRTLKVNLYSKKGSIIKMLLNIKKPNTNANTDNNNHSSNLNICFFVIFFGNLPF